MFKTLMVVLFALSFIGCTGTLEGMGKDIEKMGKTIKESVNSDKESDKDADTKK